MSTTYEATTGKCPTCHRSDTIEIGWKAAGWRFTFRANEEHNLKIVADWIRFLSGPKISIKNEYGHDLTLIEFLRVALQIDDRCHVCEYPEHGYHDIGHIPLTTS